MARSPCSAAAVAAAPENAVVGRGRDARRERVGNAAACDREHLARPEPGLALDVQLDPRPERQTVAEARVDASTRGASAHSRSPARSRRRRSGDRRGPAPPRPGGRPRSERAHLRSAARRPAGPSRLRARSCARSRGAAAFSAAVEQHGEPDRELVEDRERDRLEGRRDRIDSGKRDGDAGDDEVADAPLGAQRLGREHTEPGEADHEDRQLEDDRHRDQHLDARTRGSPSRGSGCRRSSCRSS